MVGSGAEYLLLPVQTAMYQQKSEVSELLTPHLTRLEMYRMHQCGVGSNIKFYCLFLAKDSEAACEEAMVGSGGHQSYCQSHGKALPPTTTATTTNRLVDNILLWNEEEGSSTTQSAREYNELWKSKFKDPLPERIYNPIRGHFYIT